MKELNRPIKWSKDATELMLNIWPNVEDFPLEYKQTEYVSECMARDDKSTEVFRRHVCQAIARILQSEIYP